MEADYFVPEIQPGDEKSSALWFFIPLNLVNTDSLFLLSWGEAMPSQWELHVLQEKEPSQVLLASQDQSTVRAAINLISFKPHCHPQMANIAGSFVIGQFKIIFRELE